MPSRRALAHRELLLPQVEDEHRVGLALHVGDTAEVRLELLELAEHGDALLRREQLELVVVAEAAQVVQPVDPVGDRAPVGEQAAEPAVVDVRHAERFACSSTASCACFFVPTNRTEPPRSARFRTNS